MKLILSKDRMEVQGDSLFPMVRGGHGLVLGSPILGGRVDLKGTLARIEQEGIHRGLLRELNGEFLVASHRGGQVRLATDRFSSIPCYFFEDGGQVVASPFYYEVARELSARGRFHLNDSAVFQFLWFQRLFGTSTYDTQTQCLRASSIYELGKGCKKYWEPPHQKVSHTLTSASDRLLEVLSHSIALKTKDLKENQARVGMMLSGGLDSRLIASCFPQGGIHKAFTLGPSVNNEVRAAQSVAELLGVEHQYLPLKEDPYSEVLPDSSQLGGGMYAFDHFIFAPFRKTIAPQVDTLFHGHGVDYMFQGMYVPSRNPSLWKFDAQFRMLRKLPKDLISDFVSNISYGNQSFDLYRYVRKERRAQVREELTETIAQELRQFGDGDPYTLWDRLVVENLSRHYSYPNVISTQLCSHQRTTTFENSVFDFFWELEPKLRMNGKVVRHALRRKNPRVAEVRTGNSNVPAHLLSGGRQLYWLKDVLKTRLGLQKTFSIRASAEHRTWPDRGQMYRRVDALNRVAKSLRRGPLLEQSQVLDKDAVCRDLDGLIQAESTGSGKFLTFLISQNEFLASLEAR